MANREQLSELLSRLETMASEGLARLTFQGHAIGKTGDNVHLAISSGVVAIPSSEIKSVIPMFGHDPKWVSIVVRNADSATHIRRVRPINSLSYLPPWGGGADKTCTDNCHDTATVTSEEGTDATDDAYCEPGEDDDVIGLQI